MKRLMRTRECDLARLKRADKDVLRRFHGVGDVAVPPPTIALGHNRDVPVEYRMRFRRRDQGQTPTESGTAPRDEGRVRGQFLIEGETTSVSAPRPEREDA